jgi:hypothetical protein
MSGIQNRVSKYEAIPKELNRDARFEKQTPRPSNYQGGSLRAGKAKASRLIAADVDGKTLVN